MASPGFSRRRHHARGQAVLWILGLCWVVGLVGLQGSRLSSLQVPLLALGGFLAYWLVGAVRRRAETDRARAVHPAGSVPQTCVVVRKFGREVRPVRPDWGGSQTPRR